jgi:hypothetical protein
MLRLIRALRRRIRDRRRDERGQALPLAAVGIFAMVLGVLATLNLGQAVHQRIKLQNTADSAAYTLAAMEARTFNYIAFLNRVQIAHYNTAMVVQSYMTWVGFQVALYGTSVDLLSSLRDAAKMGQQLCVVPYLKPFWAALVVWLEAVATIQEMMRKFAVQAFELGERIGHYLVEAMAIFNRDAVWQTQVARAALLNVHILSGMQNYIEKLDKDISFTSGKSVFLNVLVNAAFNSIEYYQTFDSAAGINPMLYGIIKDYSRVFPSFKGSYHKKPPEEQGSGKVASADAYRIMTELCHATRTPRFVSNRGDWVGATQLVPGFLLVSGNKKGQTKFTKDKDLSNAEIKAIRNEENYAPGVAFSSDDFLDSGTGGGLGFMGAAIATVAYTGSSKKIGDAIAAYEDETKHYRYTGSGNSNSLVVAAPPPTQITSPKFETQTDETPHRHWPGFAPYFIFKPSSDRTKDFNQPSTWIFLNKHHQDFQTDNGSLGNLGAATRAPWFTKFEWRNGSQVVQLDSTIGGKRNSYLFEGLNVLSRGMAYYHRPGNWKEHPNFFNPFWRARLAPVGQKLQSFWDRWVTQNITTSSESQVVKGFISFLRNAQMDVFTSFITGLITH